MTRLVHAGSAVVDYVYRIDTLPMPGAEKVAASYARVAGGGFNMMVAAARTGMNVVFAGQHGTGPDGDFLRAAFKAEEIETLAPRSAELDTGNCVVIITNDAERTFVSWPGAEGRLDATAMKPVALKGDDWVFSSGYTLGYPGSRKALADWIAALPATIPFVFDPTPVVSEIPIAILTRVLSRTTWLSCNTTEATAIAGSAEIATNAERLLSDFCPGAAGVVIRSGAAGAFLRLRDGTSQDVPGFAVNAIDTNGAGDTHIGAFVSALARAMPPFDAVRYANAAAAISVTRHGGSSAPTHFEIQGFLAERAAEAPEREAEKIND
jgi:sugar/nucleoside kinase (ribokinase family)